MYASKFSMTNWTRAPFLGGCHYYADHATVTGHYSPADPVEFESDCTAWTASNVQGQTFRTADAAMDAADKS